MVVAARLPVEPRPARNTPRAGFGTCLALACALGGALFACGDDSGDPVYHPPKHKDSGPLEFDANVPELPVIPGSGAWMEPDGAPPDALVGASCAVDSNKLYELVRSPNLTGATDVAVDLVESRFGVAYVSTGVDCLDALYLAEIQGPLSEPEIATAIDECSTIEGPALAHSDGRWLIAFVDHRMAGRDIWVQAFDPRAKQQLPPRRITDSASEKSEIGITGLGSEGALIAWVEQDAPSVANNFLLRQSIRVRALWPDGKPYAEATTLTADAGESIEYTTYASLRLSRIGASGAILGYREDYVRYQGKPCDNDDTCAPDGKCSKGECVLLDGQPRNDVIDVSENRIVLEALDLDGKRTRDPWTLTDQAGQAGNVDLATDETGGAAVYSLAQGIDGSQVWIQRLDPMGDAEDVIVGTQFVGKEDATRVVGPPVRGVNPSITQLPQGFAVAYRALPLELPDCTRPGQCQDANGDGIPDPPPDNGVGSPRIRVVFLGPQANVADESDVALSEALGGPTSIEAAFDGRVVVSWTDLHDDATSSLYAARLPCVGR